MKLYYAPGTCSLACWIALEWAGLDYQVEAVDLQADGYHRINPLGTVPAVDVGGERCITQAGAILMYIADLADKQPLGADSGEVARLEFNEVMCFLTGDFHPAFWPFFAPQRYTQQADADSLASVRAAAEMRIDRAMTHLDRLIGERGYVYRDRRSVADAYAFVMARWSNNLSKTWREYVHLALFMSRMDADEAVCKVLRLSQAQAR